MSPRLIQEGFNSLWYQDVQSAEDIKGATVSRWREIQRRRKVFIEKSNKRGFRDVLIEFQIRVRGVLTKCRTTQGVLKKKEERIEQAAEGMTNELKKVRKQSRIMAEVIVDIGEIFQEVSGKIEQINSEYLTARTTLSGQTLE